jgi:adenosylcobinamide kinase/adenosylcobinamide-phosphate guanylyltransferase
MVSGTKILVLGGARSGKSQFGLNLCQKIPGKKGFLATCQPLDREMEERVARHQKSRDSSWETVEEYFDLAEQVERMGADYRVILVDCLTLWLSNCLVREVNDSEIIQLIGRFKEVLVRMPVPVVMVSNEVGMGIVPPSSLGRVFRDLQGSLNQEVAATADEVYLITAGIPLRLK